MTALGLLVLGAGVTLIYSGVKGDDPRDVLRDVLSGRSRARPGGSTKSTPASDGKSGLPKTPSNPKGGAGESGGGTGGGGGTSW